MIADSFGFGRGLSLTVESNDPRAIRFYRQEYRSSGQPERGAPSVRLQWSHSTLPALKGSGGTFHAHKLLARWRFDLSPGEDVFEIEAVGNRYALPMVHHMLVHPALRQRSSRQGMLLLHGAALVHAGRTVVLTGPGGAGKTTTSALLLSHGDDNWRLHADDYVFLAEDGATLPYLTRAHLYLDLLEQVPSLGDRLSRTERLRAALFGRLRRWSGQRLKWPVRVVASQLWPDRRLAARGELAAIFTLRRGGAEAEARRLENAEDEIEELLQMNFGEAEHFAGLLAKIQPAAECSRFMKAWSERERAILRALWAKAPVYELSVPVGSSARERAQAIEATILSSIGESRMVQA